MPAELEPGLPNVTGVFGSMRNDAGGYYYVDGNVFTNGGSGTGFSGNNVVSGSKWKMDLSKGNPIYGASESVQPPAIQLIPQIKF